MDSVSGFLDKKLVLLIVVIVVVIIIAIVIFRRRFDNDEDREANRSRFMMGTGAVIIIAIVVYIFVVWSSNRSTEPTLDQERGIFDAARQNIDNYRERQRTIAAAEGQARPEGTSWWEKRKQIMQDNKDRQKAYDVEFKRVMKETKGNKAAAIAAANVAKGNIKVENQQDKRVGEKAEAAARAARVKAKAPPPVPAAKDAGHNAAPIKLGGHNP